MLIVLQFYFSFFLCDLLVDQFLAIKSGTKNLLEVTLKGDLKRSKLFSFFKALLYVRLINHVDFSNTNS